MTAPTVAEIAGKHHEYWCGTCGIGIEKFTDWNENGGDCLECALWWSACFDAEQSCQAAHLQEAPR
jgi:hypothetical protein